MNRRRRARVGIAAGVAALTVLAACGGGGDDNKAVEATPSAAKPAETLGPQPSDVPSAPAGGDGESDSPFASAAVPESVAKGYALVWADEFLGTKLGPEWVYRTETPERRLCSPPSPTMVELKGGILRMSVARDTSKVPNVTKACPDGQYLNSFIATNTNKIFKYGIFAARIKFHAVQGAHGSFWSLALPPVEGVDKTSPSKAGVEIDVIEYFGEGWEKGGLASFIHFEPAGVKRLRSGGYLPGAAASLKPDLPSDDYHVFSVEWTSEGYIFRMDGKETFRTTKAISNVEQYVLLSLLSSDYELPKLNDDDVLPLSMNVDWVRVWQK